MKFGKWIKSKKPLGQVSPDFRRTFIQEKGMGNIKRATVRISALGVYALYINGSRIGNFVMAPGWTSYKHRIQYQSYDVTDKIRQGDENLISVKCGKGWALGNIGYLRDPDKPFPTDDIAVIFELDIEYESGRRDIIASDARWEVYTTDILDSELYDGEYVDRNAEIKLHSQAAVDEAPKPSLIPQVGEDVIEAERVYPVEYILTPSGERVIDFGQNIAGYAEIKRVGKKGDRISFIHAEVLDGDGNFYTENMRSAKNKNTYISRGGEDIFKPLFTFQGFRYIKLLEYPEDEVDLNEFCAVAIHSDIKRTGGFRCGYEKLNRFYGNIIWGQLGNYIDVPTDCPQRDERLGWTGDAEVFCRTAAINFDVRKFFEKWLADMALEQTPEGAVGGIVPNIIGDHVLISAAWGDAATICPWELYRAYGDKGILRQSYEMMKKWVEYMHGFGEEEFLFLGAKHYGDWLALDAGADQYIGATQTDLIGTAYFAFSTELVVKSGKILGEDVSCFEELYKNVRAEFRRAFMENGMPKTYPKADGISNSRPTVTAYTQTAIALILRFKLYETGEEDALANALVKLIEENGGLMSTGFVGTPHLLHALSEHGKTQTAFNLLLEERYPSWLYSVNHGATTVWEHWNGIKEDGSFWSWHMNSFNHYAYGAVYDWMFGVMVGIDIPEGGEGYSKIIYKPHTDARIGYAEASVDTDRGTVCASWRYIDGGRIRYELTVPDGTEALVKIKNLPERTVRGGKFVFIAKE